VKDTSIRFLGKNTNCLKAIAAGIFCISIVNSWPVASQEIESEELPVPIETPSYDPKLIEIQKNQEELARKEQVMVPEEKPERLNRRTQRELNKVYDSDLIDGEELPSNAIVIPTRKGWKDAETGELYDREWLEKQKASKK
jgi:hypothetical protein